MYDVLCYRGEPAQGYNGQNDLDGSFEHKSKEAREADHEQYRPGEAGLAEKGTDTLPKTMHPSLRSDKPEGHPEERFGRRRA